MLRNLQIFVISQCECLSLEIVKVVIVREEINNHTVKDIESPDKFLVEESFLMDVLVFLECDILLSAFVFRGILIILIMKLWHV